MSDYILRNLIMTTLYGKVSLLESTIRIRIMEKVNQKHAAEMLIKIEAKLGHEFMRD